MHRIKREKKGGEAIPPRGQALARSAIRPKGPDGVSLPHFHELAKEIATLLVTHSDIINLSQVPGGWFADVYVSERYVGEVCSDAILAMRSLLRRVQERRVLV